MFSIISFSQPQDFTEIQPNYQHLKQLFSSRAACKDNNDGVLEANQFWLTGPEALKSRLISSSTALCVLDEGWKGVGGDAHIWRLNICTLLPLWKFDNSAHPVSMWHLFCLFTFHFIFPCLATYLFVPAGRTQRCMPAWRSVVSGAPGLHAADRAREADHALLPAGVPGGTHRSGATSHGSVWAFQHTCKGTRAETLQTLTAAVPHACSHLVSLSVVHAVWGAWSGGPTRPGAVWQTGVAPWEGSPPGMARRSRSAAPTGPL